MYLTLAERMVQKFLKENKITAEAGAKKTRHFYVLFIKQSFNWKILIFFSRNPSLLYDIRNVGQIRGYCKFT